MVNGGGELNGAGEGGDAATVLIGGVAAIGNCTAPVAVTTLLASPAPALSPSYPAKLTFPQLPANTHHSGSNAQLLLSTRSPHLLPSMLR